MNAAGTVKTVTEARAMIRSASSAVNIGSITPLQRDGNPGDVLRWDDIRSLNSLGLPNPGSAHWHALLPVVAGEAESWKARDHEHRGILG